MPNTYSLASDPTASLAPTASSPSRLAFLVTPSDSANLATYAKALRVYNPSGVATLRVTPVNAADDLDTITLTVPAGLWIEPVTVRRVWSTGTTAGLIVHGLAG